MSTALRGKSGTSCPNMQGFTLIEMMIVVAIVGLLAAIAYPNYTDYLSKSRRSEAKTLLMDIAARQEQYFLDNRSYTNDFTDLPNLTAQAVAAGSVTSENGYYVVTISRPTLYTYTLTATSQRSDTCETLTLNELGRKDATVPASTPVAEVAALKATCW